MYPNSPSFSISIVPSSPCLPSTSSPANPTDTRLVWKLDLRRTMLQPAVYSTAELCSFFQLWQMCLRKQAVHSSTPNASSSGSILTVSGDHTTSRYLPLGASTLNKCSPSLDSNWKMPCLRNSHSCIATGSFSSLHPSTLLTSTSPPLSASTRYTTTLSSPAATSSLKQKPSAGTATGRVWRWQPDFTGATNTWLKYSVSLSSSTQMVIWSRQLKCPRSILSASISWRSFSIQAASTKGQLMSTRRLSPFSQKLRTVKQETEPSGLLSSELAFPYRMYMYFSEKKKRFSSEYISFLPVRGRPITGHPVTLSISYLAEIDFRRLQLPCSLAIAFCRIIGHPSFLSARKSGWAVLAMNGRRASVVTDLAAFLRQTVTVKLPGLALSGWMSLLTSQGCWLRLWKMMRKWLRGQLMSSMSQGEKFSNSTPQLPFSWYSPIILHSTSSPSSSLLKPISTWSLNSPSIPLPSSETFLCCLRVSLVSSLSLVPPQVTQSRRHWQMVSHQPILPLLSSMGWERRAWLVSFSRLDLFSQSMSSLSACWFLQLSANWQAESLLASMRWMSTAPSPSSAARQAWLQLSAHSIAAVIPSLLGVFTQNSQSSGKHWQQARQRYSRQWAASRRQAAWRTFSKEPSRPTSARKLTTCSSSTSLSSQGRSSSIKFIILLRSRRGRAGASGMCFRESLITNDLRRSKGDSCADSCSSLRLGYGRSIVRLVIIEGLQSEDF